MRIYFWFSAVYLGFALIVALVFMNDVTIVWGMIGGSADLLLTLAKLFVMVIGIGTAVLLLVVDRKTLLARLTPFIYALVGAVFMNAGFTMLKNSMTFLTDFFADPFLAKVDRALHFGVDPWVIAHRLADYLPMEAITYNYAAVWGLPALALPAILAATDGDRVRVRRTLVLYVLAWVLIGNVLALAFLSAGPVYYDRLLGVSRFSGLTAALQASGVADSIVGQVQDDLWEVYSGRSAGIGSGISAFPSVHVAISTVLALYLAERSKWLIPLGFGFLVSIFFYSVYCGFHYAVDGYFSVLVISSLWWWLRHKMPPQ